MTFEQTNEKQRQRMKADARSHIEAARMILANPLYARLKGGEDLYTAVWALWESLAGTGLSNMTAGAVCHACKTHDLDQLDWALTSIAETGSIRPYSTPTKHPLHCTNCGKECRPHAGTPILCSQCKENLRRRKTKQGERKTKTMNDLDEYIHRCRVNLEPHHLQPADEPTTNIASSATSAALAGISAWTVYASTATSNGDANTTPHTASGSTPTSIDGSRSIPTNSAK